MFHVKHTAFCTAFFIYAPIFSFIVPSAEPRSIPYIIDKSSLPAYKKLAKNSQRSNKKGVQMEQKDLDLIAAWQDEDPELKRLWREHLEFEEQLDSFNRRVYLSPTEELERKTLQKKKLKGRDQLERILVRLRQRE